MVSIPPGSSLGRYRVVQQLGRGGMATVFRCHDPNLDRYVAIKVLPSYYTEDPTFVGRFAQEAQTIARLNHPNILQIYDFGEDKGFTYIVSELVPGGTLQDRLKGQPKDIDEVLKYMRPLAEALDYAHAQGIVHRDLKPANVLLDASDRPILADFGLARMLESATRFTQAHQALGTPEYMAPEQAMGADADHRSDLYAIGIMIYQMLLGQTPFRADTPAATLMAHVHRPLPLPTSINAGISPKIEAMLLKALAKEPDDRFQSAKDMVHAMEMAAGKARAPVSDMDFGATAVLDLSQLQASQTQDFDTAATMMMDTGKSGTMASQPTQAINRPGGTGAVRGGQPTRAVAPPPRTQARADATGVVAADAPAKSRMPMMLAIAGATAIIAVIAIVAIVLSQGGGNGEPSDSPPPAAANNPTPPPADEPTSVPVAAPVPTEVPQSNTDDIICPGLETGQAPATNVAEALTVINRLRTRAEEGVIALRDIENPPAVEPELRTKRQLCDITRGFYRRPDTRDQIFEAEELYKTLGLMSEEESLENILLGIQLQQAFAVYDDASETVYVVSDSTTLGPREELGYASAYMAVLQQQEFDISQLRSQARNGTSDEFRAVTALISGDVSQVSQGYVSTLLDRDQQRELSEPLAENRLLTAPEIVRKTVLFPSQEGGDFVAHVFGVGREGWPAVNHAYSEPPISTEQILHPEKYIAMEAPQVVTLPNISGRLGAGWTLTTVDTMGEFLIRSYLEEHLDDVQAEQAADGWGGDRYFLLSHPEKGRLFVGQIVFDAFEEADEFANAYQVFVGLQWAGTGASSESVGQTGRRWINPEGGAVFMGRTGPAVLLAIGQEEATLAEALTALFAALEAQENQSP